MRSLPVAANLGFNSLTHVSVGQMIPSESRSKKATWFWSAVLLLAPGAYPGAVEHPSAGAPILYFLFFLKGEEMRLFFVGGIYKTAHMGKWRHDEPLAPCPNAQTPGTGFKFHFSFLYLWTNKLVSLIRDDLTWKDRKPMIRWTDEHPYPCLNVHRRQLIMLGTRSLLLGSLDTVDCQKFDLKNEVGIRRDGATPSAPTAISLISES